MSVLIKHMAMPKGCIYANDKDQTEYCPMLNHDDVPFCQYIENEPEIAIGIDERPVYCPFFDVPDTNVGDLISRQAVIDAYGDWYVEEGTAEGFIGTVKQLLEGLPSAQPKSGMWILDRSGAYCCSECMEPCAGYVMMKPRDKYCKMCGAKMEVTE